MPHRVRSVHNVAHVARISSQKTRYHSEILSAILKQKQHVTDTVAMDTAELLTGDRSTVEYWKKRALASEKEMDLLKRALEAAKLVQCKANSLQSSLESVKDVLRASEYIGDY